MSAPPSLRIDPATRGSKICHFGRSPAPDIVRWGYGGIIENGFDNLPCQFRGILAGEKLPLTGHRIADQPLIRRHVASAVIDSGQLHCLAQHAIPGGLATGADTNCDVGAQPETEVIGGCCFDIIKKGDRRALEPDHDFGCAGRQILPGSDVEWHAVPSPRRHTKPDGGKGLAAGCGCDTRLLKIPLELSTHDVGGTKRGHGLQYLHFFIDQII